jgi:multicomponent Na+:H+ antiporter subunit G
MTAPTAPAVRAGDHDRDSTANQLGKALTQGYLAIDEYETRLQAKPQVLGLLLVLAGAAIRLRGNIDVGMVTLTGLFTVITAPVVANRVGQLAYREQNIRDDLLTKDEMHEFAEKRESGGSGQN